ncbi:hypothetical protein BH10ACT7_BH10ACT7_24220 [soil metagenome]
MSPARSDRRSVLTGWVLVAGIALGIAALAVGTTLSATIYSVPLALAFVLSAVQAVAIPLAIPRPVLAGIASTVAIVGLAVAQSNAGHAPWPWAVLTIVSHSIVLALIGLQARSRTALAFWAVGVLGTVLVVVALPTATDAPVMNVIIATSVCGVAVGAGIVWREWRSIRAQLISERTLSAEERDRRVLAEEKTRIARELHDVVAHSMSIINAQASSAVYRHTDVSAPVAREFDEIADAARGAIADLRGVLGVLRDDGTDAELHPQPGLDDIADLVQSTARSGVTVDLDLAPELSSASVSQATGLAAYRVVQEAISNAIRHAPGSTIRVVIADDVTSLTVSVMNSASAVAAASHDVGHGLIGMRERVTAVGGSLTTGATVDGGFSVVARFPLREVRA